MKDKIIIRKLIKEAISSIFDEERIPNTEADESVNNLENFIGSHTYGEDIGGIGKLYVAYSYGEQHPLYVWIDKHEFQKMRPNETNTKKHTIKHDLLHFYDNKKLNNNKTNKSSEKNDKNGSWFYNEKPYYIRDKKGKIKQNKWTQKHIKQLKPNERAQARETRYLQKLIKDFKNQHKVGSNNHTCLKPGEK